LIRDSLSQTMPMVIETEEENERMLAVLEKLMDKGETYHLKRRSFLSCLPG
jgi:hypothetical protein